MNPLRFFFPALAPASATQENEHPSSDSRTARDGHRGHSSRSDPETAPRHGDSPGDNIHGGSRRSLWWPRVDQIERLSIRTPLAGSAGDTRSEARGGVGSARINTGRAKRDRPDVALSALRKKSESLRVALAGNPNCGKSTLFNALTGARQHVGNYAGVTVEKHDGTYRYRGQTVNLTDLPGTYSLSAYSPEERITQLELLSREYDVVVVVVDATTLRRSLILLAQIMQLRMRLVLCLNMSDEAHAAGQELDLARLRKTLGFPVVETVGHHGKGLDDLRAAIASAHNLANQSGQDSEPEREQILDSRFTTFLKEIRDALSPNDLPSGTQDWIAIQLLAGDELVLPPAFTLDESDPFQKARTIAGAARHELEKQAGRDISLLLTESYRSFIDGLLQNTLVRRANPDARRRSDKIDELLVHPVLGLPIFGLVMYATFWVTFTLGDPPMEWIESGFAALGDFAGRFLDEDSWIHSLVVDGIIGGVGGVTVFLPNVLLLFLSLAFLENTGYMARAAFLMDRVMHRFGLHGRSFLPMMSGFGCNIPAILATRTLENERDRLTTMMVLPLMSCGARLTIWMLLIPAFFPEQWRAGALFLIYAIGILLALGGAWLLRRTLLKGEDAPFVMEFPPYRLPTLRALLTKVIERGYTYVRSAGTIILAISIVMWFAATYPKKQVFEIDTRIAAGEVIVAEDEPGLLRETDIENIRTQESLRYSLAGRVGGMMEPLIRPLGFDWKLGTAMLGAFVAKEVFVAQVGVVYAMGEVDENSDRLRAALRRDYSPLVGFSMMLFLLIGTPCMATIAVTRRESGSWKWALLQFGGWTAVAYVASLLTYQLGRLFLA
jgi:ferrous iron transport protein B